MVGDPRSNGRMSEAADPSCRRIAALALEAVDEVPRVPDDVLTRGSVRDHVRVTGHILEEVGAREEAETDSIEKSGHVLRSRAVAEVDPVHDCLKHLFLRLHVQGVIADDLAQVLRLQKSQVLVTLSRHLYEFLENEI